MNDNDFLLVQALKHKSIALFKIYRDNIFVLGYMLRRYRNTFGPTSEYTALHALDMADLCCHLIGEANIQKLTAEETFILLMSCYMRDIGLNTDSRTVMLYFQEYGVPLDAPGDAANRYLTDDELRLFLQHHHLEISAFMVRHYRKLFDFPTDAFTETIARIIGTSLSDLTDPEGWQAVTCSGGMPLRLYDLAVTLGLADKISHLADGAADLALLQDMAHHHGDSLTHKTAHLAAIGITYEDSDVLLNMQGSDAVYELLRSRADKVTKQVSFFADKLEHFPLQIDRIVTNKVHVQGRTDAYVNKEIEQIWTAEDWDCFNKIPDDERELYLRYLAIEHKVTDLLDEFTTANHLQLVSLEHRFKTPTSVYEKLYVRPEQRALNTLNDVLRYTIILPESRYVTDAERLLDKLSTLGFRVRSVKNAWLQTNIPYNGLNVKCFSEEGFRLEIQFHTPDSYRVKSSEEDYALYRRKRQLDPYSPEYQEIEKQQFALYDNMMIPAGIARFKWSYAPAVL